MRIELEVDSVTGEAQIISIQKSDTVTTSPANPTPWGVDQFGTPFTSAADRDRMHNLLQWQEQEAAHYHGAINPDDLGLYDWAYYVQSGLWRSGAQDYAIFTKKPVVRDPADGRVLQTPEAELAAVDVSGYGGPLAAFAL